MFLLFGSYILQQRYKPFLSAGGISGGLNLSEEEVEKRLEGRRSSRAPELGGGGILRKRSRKSEWDMHACEFLCPSHNHTVACTRCYVTCATHHSRLLAARGEGQHTAQSLLVAAGSPH